MATSARYASAETLADRMIGKYGRVTTFTRGAPQIDPVTQQITGSAETYTAKATAFPMSTGKARLIFGEGANVLKRRLEVHIALRGVAKQPAEGDRFSWGGISYSLLAPEPLDPDGGGAFYTRAYAEAA